MNAKLKILCRVVGIAFLVAGMVEVAAERLHSATFQRIPEFHGFVGGVHISFVGIVGVMIGAGLIYLGFRAPGKPSR